MLQTSRAPLAGFVVFLVIAVGNAITHGLLGRAFMAESISRVAATSDRPETFVFLTIVWLMIAVATVYFVSRDAAPTVARAAVAGAIVGLLVDGSWNLINKAQWAVWSDALIVIDIAWHVLHGAVAGVVARAVMRPKAAVAPA